MYAISTETEMQFADAAEHLLPLWDDFFDLLAQGIEEITQAWQNHNLSVMTERVHCYKGQVMVFQYQAFNQRFEQLEALLRAKDLQKIPTILIELQHYFQQEVNRYETYKNCHC